MTGLAAPFPLPGLRPWLPALRDRLLAAFFVALAFSISVSQALLIALLLVLPWTHARRLWAAAAPLRHHPLTNPFAAFAGLTLLSALLSGDPGGSLWMARDLTRIATFYLVLAYTRDADHAWRLWTGFLVVLTLMAAYGLGQVYLCGGGPGLVPESWLAEVCPHRSRVSGPFSIYMTFGGVLLLGSLFLAAALANVPWRRIWWMVPAGAVTVGALAFTYSRNAWLGLAAGTAGLVVTARRGARVAVLLAVAVAVVGALSAGGVMQRARSILNPEDATIRDRVAMWQSGLAMIRQNPIFGVGPGQVRVWYPHYRRPEAVRLSTGHLHNSPIQVAAERGLPALGVWIWLWVTFFGAAWRVLRRVGRDRPRERALVSASLWGIVGFLVAGLFEHNFGDGEVVMLVYALMAIPWIVARDLPAEP
jgi:putative inorganic carbon (hco3(-)) transporter